MRPWLESMNDGLACSSSSSRVEFVLLSEDSGPPAARASTRKPHTRTNQNEPPEKGETKVFVQNLHFYSLHINYSYRTSIVFSSNFTTMS